MTAATLRSVLVVDDNPDDLLIAEHVLRKSGQVEHILIARDGSVALELYKNHEATRTQHPNAFPPNLLLLDINMPILGGFEVLEAFEALELPEAMYPKSVIMLSSSDASRDRAAAEKYPQVQGFLVKPLRREQIADLAARFGASPRTGLAG